MNHTEGIMEVTEAVRYCDDQYEKMYKNWKKKKSSTIEEGKKRGKSKKNMLERRKNVKRWSWMTEEGKVLRREWNTVDPWTR